MLFFIITDVPICVKGASLGGEFIRRKELKTNKKTFYRLAEWLESSFSDREDPGSKLTNVDLSER